MRAPGSSTRVRLMMKLLLSAAVVLLWTPRVSASTIVDFTGVYAPGSWTTTVVNCGNGTTSEETAFIKVFGCNDGSGSGGHVELTHVAHTDGTVSFHWLYQVIIGSFPYEDPGSFVLNGVLTGLSTSLWHSPGRR